MYASLFVALYFEVFMLINFLEKRSSLKQEETLMPQRLPTITVIVPAYNEEKTVVKTVFSLLKLDYPKEKLRIIVVDDGSTDKTPEVLRRFRGHKRVTLLHKQNGGKYTALNSGIAISKSELIGCLDADSFVPPDTLGKIIPYFNDEKTMAVTPAMKIHRPDRFIRRVQSDEYDLGIFMKKCFSILHSITVTPGPFSIFRRQVFDNLGPFRAAHNTEDLEIAMRMQKNFYGIRNAHTAMVYTVGPGTIRKLYRQRVRWIYGFLANMIDYRVLLFNRKYKHLGMFTLPGLVLSIIMFFLSLAIGLWSINKFIWQKILEFQAVGLHWPAWRFDWINFTTDAKLLLFLILFGSTIALAMAGRRISEKKTSFSFHIIYFPIAYVILSIFWLSRAVLNVAIAEQAKWR